MEGFGGPGASVRIVRRVGGARPSRATRPHRFATRSGKARGVKKVRPRGGGSGAARAGTTETERTRRRRTAWRTVDPSQFGRRKPSTLRARAWAARQRDWPGEVRNQGDFASENFFGHDVRFCRNRLVFAFYLWPSSQTRTKIAKTERPNI